MLTFAISAAVVVFVAWASHHLSASQRTRRQLGQAPTKRIAELGDNDLGKVVGRTRGLGEILEAPLTGRRCLYFIAVVEERQDASEIAHWETALREARGVTFMLEDDSGRALIDATDARIALDFDGRGQSGTFDDPTPTEKAFLDRHGEQSEGWLRNRNMRYREAVIEEGQTIAVLGAGTREPDPDGRPTATYRGDAPTRLRLTSSRKYPLVISDDPTTTRT